jgi:NitT/TauT family transport system permease protein
MRLSRLFTVAPSSRRAFTPGDLFVLIVVAFILYLGIRLAFATPAVVQGPDISLSPSALPWYAAASVGRMAAAYILSLVFALVYGRVAAQSRSAERILMPLLDIFQSIPILSFLPVVLLSFSAVLPEDIAVELASVVLIFTSQVWNLIFAWYQSLITIPKELREASATFRLNGWMRLKTLELPFAANNLIWNSIMSWAGGWFFLMAAEIFTVGERDFRLPGLGTYLQEAANQGDLQAIFWGIAALIVVIVAFDQLLWNPILTWADRFKIEMVESDEPLSSWFYNLMAGSRLVNAFFSRIWQPINNRIDALFAQRADATTPRESASRSPSWLKYPFAILGLIFVLYGIYTVAGSLAPLPITQWAEIGVGLLATLFHVVAALVIAVAWTLPVGVLIGTNKRLARFLQPVVQILASVPATAFFPVLVLFLVRLTGSLTIPAILLMLMGTQWYLLFNVIAGANAIPQDMKHMTTLLQLSCWQRWRTLILPALFPFIITGAITASGGAWNASIVAEYIQFGGETLKTNGIGAVIAEATARGDYALLLAATLSMITTVVLINRFIWRRLYRLASEKYRME